MRRASGAYRYADPSHAAGAATLALQAHEQHLRRFEAEGSVRVLIAGSTCTLAEHGSLDGDYTVLRVRHERPSVDWR